jgi:TusA-related sulfurtransferase
MNFDRAGKFNFRSAQRMLQIKKRVDGDILTVLTTNDAGTAPAVAFYEAHQLANPENGGEAWQDGVKIGKGGVHLAYGLKGDDDKVTVVPAGSVIYFGAFDSPGHPRAISPFAHAVNHSIDITEIRADTKHGIKAAAQVGLQAYSDTQAQQGKAQQGMPGVLKKEVVRGGTNADGEEEKWVVQTRKAYGGGALADLPPGKKLEVLHDARPSTNQMQFMDELIRDISVGFGLPPEVIWKMINLTGPGVRFIMDYAGRWIEDEQAQLEEWAERVWLYFTAWEIVHGNLELPKKADKKGAESDWMEVEFLPQRDLTIDRGKDGKLQLEILDRGLGTEADFHRAYSGKDFEEQTLRHLDEVKFKMDQCEKLGIPFERAYPPRAGAAPQEKEDEEDPPPEKGKSAE